MIRITVVWDSTSHYKTESSAIRLVYLKLTAKSIICPSKTCCFRYLALSAGKEVLLWWKSTKPRKPLPYLVLEMLKELIMKTLDQSEAHHATVKRIRFAPSSKAMLLASCSTDHSVFQLSSVLFKDDYLKLLASNIIIS